MICERSWLRKLQVDGVCLDIHGHRARDSWFKETARFLYHSPGKTIQQFIENWNIIERLNIVDSVHVDTMLANLM